MQLDNAERFDPLHGTWEALAMEPVLRWFTMTYGWYMDDMDDIIYMDG